MICWAYCTGSRPLSLARSRSARSSSGLSSILRVMVGLGLKKSPIEQLTASGPMLAKPNPLPEAFQPIPVVIGCGEYGLPVVGSRGSRDTSPRPDHGKANTASLVVRDCDGSDRPTKGSIHGFDGRVPRKAPRPRRAIVQPQGLR